nr:TPA_asm: cupiennin [Ladona dragonfly adintovirus]
MSADARRYLFHVGGGAGDGNNIGQLYVTTRRLQRGRGLGSIFQSVWKLVRPLMIKGAKSVGREALHAGIGTLNDVATGRNVREAFKERFSDAGHNLKRKAEEKISSLMSGSGLKIARKSRKNRVVKRRRVQKGGRNKKKKSKKRGKKLKNKKKKRCHALPKYSDIFI